MEDKVRFQSLASGSSGNCYYIGNSTCGLLIDAGISSRTIRKNLKDIGVELEQIWGIFVTHDHADHIRGVGALGERFRIPVYATEEVHWGINRNYCVSPKLCSCQKYIRKSTTIEIGGFRITSFPVSHDATDNVGYTVEYQEKKITFATDLGYVSDAVIDHLREADYLVLEANYDEKMLMDGKYPYFLKQRIMADTGHLSNDQTGKCLSKYYHERLKHVFLCHLSKENNLPELAYTTIKQHLENSGIRVGHDLLLTTLERFSPSDIYYF